MVEISIFQEITRRDKFNDIYGFSQNPYNKNVFAYSCVSENSEHLLPTPQQKLTYIFLVDKGFDLPLAVKSPKNVSFFDVSPNIR